MEKSKDRIIATRSDNIIEARYSLTNKQNIIIDMLLTEIKDDDNLKYSLSMEKFKPLIETDTSNIYRDLKTAVKAFENKGLRIIDKESNEEIWFSWFSKIHYKPRKGTIDVNIDPDFKKILYEVKKRIYYDLQYTINMKSSYSQRFYYFLKSFEDTGWRLDRIEDLILKMECPKSCVNFARFEDSVLSKAHKEINEKTDLNFEYEVIKTGRKVTHIKSLIKSKNKSTISYTHLSVDYIINTIGGLIDQETDPQKILKVIDMVNPENPVEYYSQEVDKVSKYHKKNTNIKFIALLINALKKPWKDEGEQIGFKYNNGLNSTKKVIKPTGFNNFDGREYTEQDYKNFEDKLVYGNYEEE